MLRNRNSEKVTFSFSCCQIQENGHSLSSCLRYFGSSASQTLSILINFQFSVFQGTDIKLSFRRHLHQFINPHVCVREGMHVYRDLKQTSGLGAKETPLGCPNEPDIYPGNSNHMLPCLTLCPFSATVFQCEAGSARVNI